MLAVDAGVQDADGDLVAAERQLVGLVDTDLTHVPLVGPVGLLAGGGGGGRGGGDLGDLVLGGGDALGAAGADRLDGLRLAQLGGELGVGRAGDHHADLLVGVDDGAAEGLDRGLDLLHLAVVGLGVDDVAEQRTGGRLRPGGEGAAGREREGSGGGEDNADRRDPGPADPRNTHRGWPSRVVMLQLRLADALGMIGTLVNKCCNPQEVVI